MQRNHWAKYRRPGRCLSNGYVQVSLKEHPLFPDKIYEYEHRVVMAEFLGRPLRRGEEVHHKKAKTNNKISNLKLMSSRRDHAQQHRKPCSPATRAKISAATTGLKRTPEQRARMSRAQIGKKRSADFKARVSKTLKGKTVSDETRRKLSAANKGRKFGPRGSPSITTIIKMRQAARRTHADPKVRKKYSNAARRAWANPTIRARQIAAIRQAWAFKKKRIV